MKFLSKLDNALLNGVLEFVRYLYERFDIHPLLPRLCVRIAVFAMMALVLYASVLTLKWLSPVFFLVCIPYLRLFKQTLVLQKDASRDWDDGLYQKYMKRHLASQYHPAIVVRITVTAVFCTVIVTTLRGSNIDLFDQAIVGLFFAQGLHAYFDYSAVPPTRWGAGRSIAFRRPGPKGFALTDAAPE